MTETGLAKTMASLLDRYRSTGADLPWTDPVRAHRGVAMEGYFWRITEPSTGRVLIALCGANLGPGGSWSTVGLAAWPEAFVRTAAVDGAWSDPHRLGVRGGRGGNVSFEGDADHLRVSLGPDARLEVELHDQVLWPHRLLGGSSVFQLVPNLNQYWHPWLLGGRATGQATVGTSTLHFENARVYAEKNWGREGFPESWWWGQAQGFEGSDASGSEACVAFAGGLVRAGRMQVEVTALVVRLPDGRVIRLGDPAVSPVRARISEDRWRLRGRGFGWRIEVSATAPIDQSFVLPVPLPSEHRNVPGDLEHLAGDLDVSVYRFGRRIWRGQTALAALEHGGLAQARQELRRRGLDETQPAAPPMQFQSG